MKFIHVSDLHYHRSETDNRDANQLLKTIATKYPEHYLIVTGDITDDGHEKQYHNAFDALSRFKDRVFVAPGNHDFGAAGSFYSRERAERFDRFLAGPLEQGGTFYGPNPPVVNVLTEGGRAVMLIALDTSIETDHPWDFACGQIGDAQLSALDTVLCTETARKAVKILFFHHHPFMHNNPFMELKDARALMRLIFGRIHVLAFGHKHVSSEWQQWGGIPWVIASDDSPGKKWAREITVRKGQATVKNVSVVPARRKPVSAN